MDCLCEHSQSNHSSKAPWEPWSPSDNEPWNQRRVIHLHRRAGFAATWLELNRDLKDGPELAIKRLLSGTSYETGVPEDFDAIAPSIGASAKESLGGRLYAWWIYRMIFSPDPLNERLTLMWHNHFATSNTKVRSNRAMFRQNQIFRHYGRGEFGELFKQIMHDPAILIYLDANSNRASHPNENLGREMLELFSLGEGNYSETDVRNAARCLTGWIVDKDKLSFEPNFHDASEKSLLGRNGYFKGDDAVAIALDHPATAQRITWRVCQLLMGENVVDREALSDLASRFRNKNMDVNWLVETILKSKLFFSELNIGNRILGAAEFAIASIRVTGAHMPSPNTTVIGEWMARMGQKLFHPPTVFGFPEGRSWITSQWLVARKQFVSKLLAGSLHGREFDIDKSLRAVVGGNANAVNPKFLTSLLLSTDDQNIAEGIAQTKNVTSETMLLRILTSPLANLG